MEEVDTITVAVSGIDINKVEPLDTRRLVTFINHYLATTVSFLNHFATQCESKLDRMQQQLHRVECRLKLLECKLGGIPGLPPTPTGTPGTSSSSSSSKKPGDMNMTMTTEEAGVQTEVNTVTVTTSTRSPPPEEEEEEEVTKEVTNVKEDPRYAKYFKMVTVGVPLQAVKLKMRAEGIDPSIMDQ